MLFNEAAKERDLVFVLLHGFRVFHRCPGGLCRTIPIQPPSFDDVFGLSAAPGHRRHAAQAHPDPRAFLVRAGKELAVLLAGEVSRLDTILRRIKG